MATEKAPRAQVKKEHDAGRWSRVSRRMWLDKRFRTLSSEGRMLWMYLLTTPHAGPIPGLFAARESAIAEDLRWSMKELRGAFGELASIGFEIEADWDAGLVWLPNAVKHNPPPNPSVVTGWRTALVDTLPECELLNRALASIRTQLCEMLENPGPYVDAFDAVFRNRVADTLSDTVSATLSKRVADNTTHDARRTTQEVVGAGAPAATTLSASPTSVPPSVLPPAVEADREFVRALGADPEPLPDGQQAYAAPWSLGLELHRPPGDRPRWHELLWLWCSYRRHERCSELDLPDTAGDEPASEQLASALERCGTVDRFRQAWLCWLGEDYARNRKPPFAWPAFASAKQLPQMLSRAASVAWAPLGEFDWELPAREQEAAAGA